MRLLRSDIKDRPMMFDMPAFEALEARIGALADESTDDARAAHLEEAQRVASGEACPWCGSELVERNGKYGPFMGCSSYPKCRYTRNR